MSVSTATPSAPTPDLADAPAARRSLGLLLALALHAMLAVIAWFCSPALNSDSATGFLIWDAWQRGGPWNHMVTADPANLARDVSVFQAWWSPGQYVIVAPWQWLGLSLGHAIAVGALAANALGLWGFWRLFLSFGFSRSVSGWAVLVIACNWTFTRPYGDYLGGEVALFAVLPWLILATRRVLTARASWLPWLALPALYWAGNMAKNSYIPMAAGVIAGVRGARLWGAPWIAPGKIFEVVHWLIWLALGHAILWATYLRLGANPSISTGGASHPAWWLALLQLVSFPVTGLFSLGNLLGRIFLHPSRPLVASMADLWPLHLAFAIASIGLLVWLGKREARARPAYAWLLAGVFGSYTAFFGLLLVVGAAAGWEERMFKPAGFLLAPALVDALRADFSRWRGRIVLVVLAGASCYGVFAALHRARHLSAVDNVGRRGITQHLLSRDALRALHALDDALPRDALVVVPSPEMALELRRTRVLPTHAAMHGVEHIASQRHAGRVGDLVVIVDQRMRASGQAQALIGGFTGYPADAWRVHRYGEWEFWHQGSFTAWPASQ